MRTPAITMAQAMFLIAVALLVASASHAQVQITLDPAVRYQTITGWEAITRAGWKEFYNVAGFDNYKDELFDRAVDELGLTRIRLEISSNIENPVGYYTQYLAGQISWDTYMANRYNIINDNADPNTVNMAGFQFALLDAQIENVVLPMRQRLAARGESLYVNLCYVDFGSSMFEHANSGAEYAEMISVVFAHMQSKYGFVPNAVEICLEPENAPPWDDPNTDGALFANVIIATVDRLAGEGYHPDIVAPSPTQMTNTDNYLDDLFYVIQTVCGLDVSDYLSEISYHRYRETAAVVDAALPSLVTNYANPHGLRTAMLEHLNANYDELHADLTIGNASAWQQYAVASASPTIPPGGTGSQYYAINNADPNNPIITLGTTAKFFPQYFKYIRPGAVRIKGTTSNASYSPAAFINANGGYVVVVKATASGSFNVVGLPAGEYGIVYTTSSQFAQSLGTVSLNQGQTLSTSIPAAGALTVYAIVATTPPVKCFVFYNNSTFDGNNPAANAADDAAIATDKVALRPGQTATFANYTSYSKGINGIMIDLPAMPGTPTLADFTFKKGNTNTPSSWSTASANTITVRPGAGSIEGYDRIEITRPDGALTKMWLQITVKATAATGLAQDEVFYFGNAIGETGNSASSARVDASDVAAVRADPHKTAANGAPISNACDINRDGKANTADEILIRQNTTTIVTDLKLITVP